jgi:hypothetical protein
MNKSGEAMRDLFDIFTDENRYSRIRHHGDDEPCQDIEDIDDNDTATIDELETIDEDIADFLDSSTDDDGAE